jgi:hypothetical protein
MPNSPSQSSGSSTGCSGCLGSLIAIVLIGSYICGYSGVSVRFGNYFLGFGTGAPQKTDASSDNASAQLGELEKTVSAAANKFHQQLSLGQFREIYAEADEQLRASISQADFIRICQTSQRSTGKLKSTELLNLWRPVDEHGSEYILSRHLTTFLNGSVEEEFVWHFVNGKPAVAKFFGLPVNPSQIKQKQEI